MLAGVQNGTITRKHNPPHTSILQLINQTTNHTTKDRRKGEQESGLHFGWNICVYLCSPICSVKHQCVCIGLCVYAFFSIRRTTCHSPWIWVWKHAPGCESALHSSPGSLEFRKHLIPSLRLHAPVRNTTTERNNEAFWSVQRSGISVPNQCTPYIEAAECLTIAKELGQFKPYVMFTGKLMESQMNTSCLYNCQCKCPWAKYWIIYTSEMNYITAEIISAILAR